MALCGPASRSTQLGPEGVPIAATSAGGRPQWIRMDSAAAVRRSLVHSRRPAAERRSVRRRYHAIYDHEGEGMMPFTRRHAEILAGFLSIFGLFVALGEAG